MKVHKIHDPCWLADVWLIWPAQNAELDRFLERQFGIKDKTTDGPWRGRCVEILEDNDEEIGMVIALDGWKGTPLNHATLSHECLHAAHYILDRRGIKFNEHTDETYCYLLDSLVRRCLEHLKKK